MSPLRLGFVLAVVSCVCLAQNRQEMRYTDGVSSVVVPAANRESAQPEPAVFPTVPVWNGSFDYLGVSYPYTMVGTDPSVAGAGTTSVPVLVVPLRFKFGSTVISANSRACGDTMSVIARVKASPLFHNRTWTEGATVVGNTQLLDAFQRSNFWNSVSSVSPDYHVLLGPVKLMHAATFVVPPDQGSVTAGPCAGHHTGTISADYWFHVLTTQLRGLALESLTLFVAYDISTVTSTGVAVPLYARGGEFPSGATYALGTYGEPGALPSGLSDISGLSSVLADWMNNPYIFSQAPAWPMTNPVSVCTTFIAPSAPLSAQFPVIRNGFTYHIPELTFLSWFARQSPSTAVNGWYSMRNTETSPPEVCPWP